MGHTKKTHNKSQWKNYNYICYEFFSLHWHAVREGKGKTWRISIFQKNKSQKIWIRFFPERMPTTWSSCSQRQQKIQQRKQHYFFLSGKILCYFEYLEIEPTRRLITMFIDSTWFSVSLSKFKKKPKIPFCSSVKRGRWRTWSPIHGSTRNRWRFIIFEMRIGPIFFCQTFFFK